MLVLRNVLLKASTADFVMPCDCDDVIYNTIGLNAIFSVIEDKRLDVYCPAFMSEYFNHNGEAHYKPFKKNHHMIQGKVFRRNYLIDNDIHWDDRIPYTGDVYFLWQAFHMTNDIVYDDNSQYLWKFNKNSVSRDNENFLVSYSFDS